MAAFVVPGRFADPEKGAKWFSRNASVVPGREGMAVGKGDAIT